MCLSKVVVGSQEGIRTIGSSRRLDNIVFDGNSSESPLAYFSLDFRSSVCSLGSASSFIRQTHFAFIRQDASPASTTSSMESRWTSFTRDATSRDVLLRLICLRNCH